jgi:hypothetical protein
MNIVRQYASAILLAAAIVIGSILFVIVSRLGFVQASNGNELSIALPGPGFPSEMNSQICTPQNKASSPTVFVGCGGFMN